MKQAFQILRRRRGKNDPFTALRVQKGKLRGMQRLARQGLDARFQFRVFDGLRFGEAP